MGLVDTIRGIRGCVGEVILNPFDFAAALADRVKATCGVVARATWVVRASWQWLSEEPLVVPGKRQRIPEAGRSGGQGFSSENHAGSPYHFEKSKVRYIADALRQSGHELTTLPLTSDQANANWRVR